jgi:hypothetical protein
MADNSGNKKMLQVRESRRDVCLDCNILAYVSKSLAGRFHLRSVLTGASRPLNRNRPQSPGVPFISPDLDMSRRQSTKHVAAK